MPLLATGLTRGGAAAWGTQGTPETLERAALAKCLREAGASPDVLECKAPRFWALRPGALVGTLTVRVTESADEQRVLQYVHSVFETNLGHCHLTVQVRERPKCRPGRRSREGSVVAFAERKTADICAACPESTLHMLGMRGSDGAAASLVPSVTEPRVWFKGWWKTRHPETSSNHRADPILDGIASMHDNTHLT